MSNELILSYRQEGILNAEEIGQIVINRNQIKAGSALSKYFGLPNHIDNLTVINYWVERIMADPRAKLLPLKALLGYFEQELETCAKQLGAENEIEETSKIPNRATFSWVTQEQIPTQIELWQQIRNIHNHALRTFTINVLSDANIMPDFYKGKSSYGYHHNKEGELFTHSYEVAVASKKMARLFNLDQVTQDAAFVGGLIHDLGKIKMYYNPNNGDVNSTHETFTFMVLAEHLSYLNQQERAIFEAIANAISPNNKQASSYIVETLVRTADRLSAEIDIFKNVFMGLPSYYHYGKDVFGKTHKRFIRQSHPPKLKIAS